MAIFINCWVKSPYLTVSGLPISITKKGESYCYLGIFLLSEGLSKSSLAKAHLDIWFFVNLVMRKAILDKQFAYLVFAIFFPIVGYRTQFSYIPFSVCNKWNALIRKSLKSKSGFLHNFLSDAIHHPSLYNLKSFEQIQAKSKSAFVVFFANSVGILSQLFFHKFHDFQILSWCSCYPLVFPIYIGVTSSNSFLAGVVCIFSGCDLSLGNFLSYAFRCREGTSMSFIFDKPNFLKCVSLLKRYGIAFVEQLHNRNGVVFSWEAFKYWKRLDPHEPVPLWFDLSIHFLSNAVSSSVNSSLGENCVLFNVCQSHSFGVVCNNLLVVDAACLSVYMDRFLSGLETHNMKAGAAVFFENINSGLGVNMFSMVSSTMAELQPIFLALECIPSFCLVNLFSDSQAALDAYKSESLLVCPDFRNQCWIECYHIANVIRQKNLDVNWIKVKGHLGILGNVRADALAKDAASFL
ncbi:hypothetical protein G9A89_010146 [Geosiphon pyriformis]|nr:hypothetical protein G9A89_010146 [Geosiphon pyriformis]